MKLLMYYLALFTRILEFIMICTIILIPIVVWLMSRYDWWCTPFDIVEIYY